ncbi:MAG: hypothetical protein AAB869_02175 [Patescibacteria group bacterium]
MKIDNGELAMKTVEAGTLVYMVNYGDKKCEDVPDQVSVCKLFWSTVSKLLGFVFWITFCYLAGPPVLLFAAKRPIGPTNFFRQYFGSYHADFSAPIKRWPRFFGHRIWPMVVLMVLFALYIIGTYVGILSALVVVFFSDGLLPFVINGGDPAVDLTLIFSLILFLSLLTVFIWFIGAAGRRGVQNVVRCLARTSIYQLCTETLRGWKENFCPMVKIVKPSISQGSDDKVA